MNFKLLALLSGATLVLAACGHKEEAANVSANAEAAMENAALAAAPTGAQAFVNSAAASDRFEVESSKLAATSAKSAAVKAFAARMVSAHTDSEASLKSTAAAMTPPLTVDDTLSADQQQMLDGLKGKSGADFDTAYAGAQVTGHQATLDLLNAYVASGDNAQLQDLARKTIPTVTAHLNLAKGLK